MDEQKRQQEAINEPEQPVWDDTADGAAYRDYGSDEDYEEDYGDEYYDTDENYDGNIPEPDPEDISYPNYEPEPTDIEPDGARLAEDGNVEFGDNFFGDVHEIAKEPEYYTDEELRNTPYEQWDTNRLDGDIRRFAPIVQEQIARRNTQARAQSLQNIPLPNDIQEVRPYTPQELSQEALQLASEKLGLEDPEDFDDYEPEHRAAMQLAMNELMEKRNAEVQGYQRGQSEWEQLQRFNADLYQRPDFNDFNNWYMGKLQEAGVTAEQVNAGLYQYARKSGNRFSVIPQIIGTWYMEYQKERGNAGRQPARNSRGYRNSPRASRPPILESTRGNDYGGSRRMNMSAFSDMDNDEQASALMRMGIV